MEQGPHFLSISGLGSAAEVQLKLLTEGIFLLVISLVSPVTSRRSQSCNHVKPSRLQGLQKGAVSFDLPGSGQACQPLPRNSHASAIQAFQTRHPDSQRTPPHKALSSSPVPARAFARQKRGNIRSPPTLPMDYISRQPWLYAGARNSTCLLLEKCVTGARGAPWDHMVPAPVPRAAREPWVAGACAEPSVPEKKAGAKGR